MSVAANPPQWQPGEVVDGLYEVVRLAGMGGMGQVYQVRHLQWGVELAVKIPHPDALLGVEDREDFVREAEAWVSLGLHPNICCCHYVRQIADVPTVFAEYVPGGSLQSWIADGRLYEGTADEVLLRVLDVAIQFAWGLDHAHVRGLVHQDVKPANVLIEPAGDDLTVKVTDFGLTKANAGRRKTTTGYGADARNDVSILVSRLGWTPAYASPEQTTAQRLSRRTDVFSYAVSVLEMFTGERTWPVGPEAGRALAEYLADGPERPGPPRMPEALASLLERCLRSDPAQRPDSMMAIAAEIAAIYRDAASSVYPRSVPRAADLLADELTNRAVSLLDLGRHADADELFAQALAADPHNARALYNAGLARWRRGAIDDDALISEIEATRADTGDPWQVRYVLALVHLERGDLSPARELLGALARERPEDPEVISALRMVDSGEIIDARCTGSWPVRWPQRPPSSDPWRAGTEPEERIALALTPDGRFLAAGAWNGRVGVWDVRGGQQLWTLKGHRRPVHAIDLTADGHFAVSVCEDESVRFWELAKGRFGTAPKGRLLYASPTPPPWDGSDGLGEVALRAQHTSIRLTADGGQALYAGLDGAFRVWNTQTGEMRTLDETAAGRLVAVSADGRRALSVGWRGRVPDSDRLTRLFDLTGGRGGEGERVVRVWDLATGRCQRELPGNGSPVTALCLSADGRFAAVGCHGGTMRVWDLDDGRCVSELQGETTISPLQRETTPATLSIDINAMYLLSGSRYSDRIQLWELDTGRCLRSFQAHRGGTSVVSLNADARGAISAGQDRKVRQWEPPGAYRGSPLLSRPRLQVELNLLGGRVDALVADAEREIAAEHFPAAHYLLRQARAIEGYERAPRVMSAWWALGRRAVRTQVRAAWSSRDWHVGAYTALDLSGDGRIAVTGGQSTVRVWDTASGSCLQILEGHEQKVQSVSLSADGRQLLSASRDGEVRVWDVHSGACQQTLNIDAKFWHNDTASVRFGVYGSQAVAAGPDNAIRVWDLDAGGPPREVRTLYGAHVSDISLSDDGRIAAVCLGNQVSLWDMERGQVMHHLKGESALTMQAASLSADGRIALAGDFEGRVRLWDAVSGSAVRNFDGPPQGGFHTIRMTADGRFAVRAGFWSYTTVWDVRSGQCVRILDGRERGALRIALTPDGRYVLAGHDEHLRLWELDWDLAARDAADWDDQAAPYLKALRHSRGSQCTNADVDTLLHRLQDVGYGWLRADAVRARLARGAD